jgi:tRNA A-37 threonylcarbamoyl transferase component Bud32
MTTDSDPLAPTLASGQTGIAATLAAATTASESPAPAPTGSDRYQLGAELGRGGMGTVYVATDRQFSREVAVKQLRKDADKDVLAARFVSESLIAGNLEHPGIPPVYERGQAGGEAFYVMRRVRGQTLAEALDEARTQEQRLELVPTLIRVAETLAYAHSQGVVHRDIKPSNIVIGHYGEAYVLDWGIAKVRGAAADTLDAAVSTSAAAGETVQGAIMGTPAYMAPEQAAGRVDAIDERTDVFALGALLYHVLTGHPPYQSSDTLTEAKECAYESVETDAPSTPHTLRTICAKAMSRRAEDRYSSAGEVASALRKFNSEAVSRQDRGAVGWLAKACTVVTAILAFFSLAAVVLTTSQSAGGYPIVVADTLAVFGIVLSFIHYKTRGTYRLSPLILAIAGGTFLVGVLAVTMGTHRLLEQAATDAIFSNADQYRMILTIGSKEAIGAVSAAASLTFVQLIAWAWAQRNATTSP